MLWSMQVKTSRLLWKRLESPHPLMLYISCGVRPAMKSARRSFLQLEGKPALETAEMQYALATFYTSRDQQKTVKLLNKSLELSDGDNLNTDIFKSLASINYQPRSAKEQAYVWAMVASAFEVPVIASTQEMKLLYGFSEAKYEQLDDIADDIKSALDSGKYKRSMMPKFN